ncbi:zinc finger protein [Fusarium albosuccineum]|uniref:Zinc finger protein n=1 Tax=Fusarium albosuccineum TaxID=1237068 RepID=A0A8H4KWK3_9HYPO|nr:zinc finger protein [Fusarium albosuccineum]
MQELNAHAERFKESLTAHDQERFGSTTFQDLQRELAAIQRHQLDTKELMNMSRLGMFLDGTKELEKTLDALEFPETREVMACIWGPALHLLKLTTPTERAFDNILDAYEIIGAELPRLLQYAPFFRDCVPAQEFLENTYKDIQRFHTLAYKLFFSLPSKLWQRMHRPIWKDFGNTFKQISDSLALHAKYIKKHGAKIVDTSPHGPENNSRTDSGLFVEDWSEAIADMDYYRSELRKLWRDFEDQEEQRKRKRKLKITSWISSSTKIQRMHEDFRKMRICPNTGRWLFRRYSEVSDWMGEEGKELPESAIWLHGNRGFGKTILASLVVDELESLKTEKRGYVVPPESRTYFFYCQEDDNEHRKHLEILKGILHQMVQADDYMHPFCEDKMSQGGGDNLANAELTQALIEAFVEYTPRQYIIIDGLDECELKETRQTAKFFMELVEKCDKVNQGQLRVMFVSQRTPELKKLLPDDDASILLKPTDNAADIREFVKKRIPEFSGSENNAHFNLKDEDKDQIEAMICQQSEDSFLYAHLAIEYLLQQQTKGDLLKKIKEEILPKDLEKIYEKLLGSLKRKILDGQGGEAMWQKSKQLLGWLVCAERTLKWHEIQAILSFDPDVPKIDFDNSMLRQDMEKYLGSLVHVLEGGHIRLIHATARRYIVQNKHISEKVVQCHLTSLCLRYLSLPCFTKDYSSADRRKHAQQGWFSFQDYACSKWHTHIDTVIRECSDIFVTDLHSEIETELTTALELFISTHREDMQQDLREDLERGHLNNFEDLPFFENLTFLWNHIYTHQKGNEEERNKVGIEQIDNALRDNRNVLEEFSPTDPALSADDDPEFCIEDQIQHYYGPNLFKCNRTLCRFFHVGYDNKKARDTHDNRHDRPFKCPVLCNSAPIGFSTNKDKDRHVRIYHPELSEGPSNFEALSRRQESGRFTCRLCNKTFTRKINLKGHERSHFGDRPERNA